MPPYDPSTLTSGERDCSLQINSLPLLYLEYPYEQIAE